MPPPLTPYNYEPLQRVQARVRAEDFDYIMRELAGGEWGMQTEIIYKLFKKFTEFLRTQNIQPYASNRTTPAKIRRLLDICVVGLPDHGLPRRTDGSTNQHAVSGDER